MGVSQWCSPFTNSRITFKDSSQTSVHAVSSTNKHVTTCDHRRIHLDSVSWMVTRDTELADDLHSHFPNVVLSFDIHPISSMEYDRDNNTPIAIYGEGGLWKSGLSFRFGDGPVLSAGNDMRHLNLYLTKDSEALQQFNDYLGRKRTVRTIALMGVAATMATVAAAIRHVIRFKKGEAGVEVPAGVILGGFISNVCILTSSLMRDDLDRRLGNAISTFNSHIDSSTFRALQ